jgi:6-pyruvoyltetrahydropterin/6-carboxytetrahydropterin synthase
MEMSLSVDFNFSSAHQLPFYDGPCKRLHGHNYKLSVTISGKTNPNDGMIRDFEEVRRKVWELALNQCDHNNLNDLMENPTAENLIEWIWAKVDPHLAGLTMLELWETAEYRVTLRR